MNEQINDIKKVLRRYNRSYITIDNELSIKKIHLLLVDNNIYKPSNVTEMIYLGLYYQNIKGMKEYYLIFINMGSSDAMYSLGVYYEEIEKDYDQMKKYFLMAIHNGHSLAMYSLGVYYEEIEKDYDQMKKYCLMAVDKGDSDAMTNLGLYYEEIEKNYDKMKKYYKQK